MGIERFERKALHDQQESQLQGDVMRHQHRQEIAQQQAQLDQQHDSRELQGEELRFREIELYQRQQQVVQAKLTTADALLQRAGAAAFVSGSPSSGPQQPDLKASVEMYKEAISCLAATLDRLQVQAPKPAGQGQNQHGSAQEDLLGDWAIDGD